MFKTKKNHKYRGRVPSISRIKNHVTTLKKETWLIYWKKETSRKAKKWVRCVIYLFYAVWAWLTWTNVIFNVSLSGGLDFSEESTFLTRLVHYWCFSHFFINHLLLFSFPTTLRHQFGTLLIVVHLSLSFLPCSLANHSLINQRFVYLFH